MRLPKRLAALLLAGLALLTLLAPALAAPPKESQAKAARGRIRIIRDDYGVPHVYAPTTDLLWYGAGYAQGQDRLWQADVLRRTATGTSAEYFGAGAVGGDFVARTLFGSAARRAAMYAAASPESRSILDAYAAGMNAWIDAATAAGRLPVEYQALGLPPPRPWTPDDSIAVFLLLSARFGESGDTELTHAAALEDLLARLGPVDGATVFADTHWLDDPDAATTAPGPAAMIATRPPAAPAITTLATHKGLRQAADELAADRAAWELNLSRVGLTGQAASNAMVVGPALSASGRPLLLGGPQMGYTAPQINHEMGLHGAGYKVTGMEIAGVPWTPIGVTPQHAWTMTSGGSDIVDLVVEVMNPANPGQYLFQGAWHDFDCRLEVVAVRGGADVSQTVCESVHGPVVGTAPGVAITRHSALRGREMTSFAAVHGVMTARSMAEFEAAVSQVAPNLNMFYVDVQGNFAYWHMGAIPVRAAGDNPWLPHDGTGGAEWQGVVAWADMPHAVNPPQGWMSSWNNKPAPGWRNSTGGFYQWGPVQRVNTLNNQLALLAPGSATMETLATINQIGGRTTDTPSGSASTVFVSTLLGEMVARVDTAADPRLPAAVAQLAGWDWLQVDADADGAYDDPAVAIFNTWWPAFVGRVFADELGGYLDPVVAGNMAYRLLHADAAIALQYDYLGGESVEAALTGSLAAALDALAVQYGSADPAAWLQPVAHIHWSPVGVGTVPDTLWMNRGTYNQIVQMGRGAHFMAQNVIAPGQSGDPFNAHFADQLPLYVSWRYKPLRVFHYQLVGHIESVTLLQP